MGTYYFKGSEKWAMSFRNFPHAGTDTNMFVESFHNRLKTFYANRKRNKRVDDLLNLLLRIEEDDFWRNKRDLFFQNYVGKDNKGRHEKGLLIPNEDVEEDGEGRW